MKIKLNHFGSDAGPSLIIVPLETQHGNDDFWGQGCSITASNISMHLDLVSCQLFVLSEVAVRFFRNVRSLLAISNGGGGNFSGRAAGHRKTSARSDSDESCVLLLSQRKRGNK